MSLINNFNLKTMEKLSDASIFISVLSIVLFFDTYLILIHRTSFLNINKLTLIDNFHIIDAAIFALLITLFYAIIIPAIQWGYEWVYPKFNNEYPSIKSGWVSLYSIEREAYDNHDKFLFDYHNAEQAILRHKILMRNVCLSVIILTIVSAFLSESLVRKAITAIESANPFIQLVVTLFGFFFIIAIANIALFGGRHYDGYIYRPDLSGFKRQSRPDPE